MEARHRRLSIEPSGDPSHWPGGMPRPWVRFYDFDRPGRRWCGFGLRLAPRLAVIVTWGPATWLDL